ncbi:MAG: hypothetical protein IPG63_17650 [Xanthomonadales bacterium]|nr:hypothetical protein [Xanthomonadales bacterium]
MELDPPRRAPGAADHDEVWTRGRDVALAIKQARPAAKVLGPVTWGWCDLFSSGGRCRRAASAASTVPTARPMAACPSSSGT